MRVALALIYPCGKAWKTRPVEGANGRETDLWNGEIRSRFLRELLQREAGPMNWWNPIQVIALVS